MANPLYNQYGNPYAQMAQEVERMRKSVPNPKAEVERLLQTGQMTQAQFNQLAQMASKIAPYLK